MLGALLRHPNHALKLIRECGEIVGLGLLPGGNALALTKQGDCITINAVHPFNRSVLWRQSLKSNLP